MTRSLSRPIQILGVLVALALATVIVLTFVPSNDFIFLPTAARPVAPLVSVTGGKDPTDGGGVYYVAVIERRANMLESLVPWIHRGATLLPAHLVVPPGVIDAAERKADLRAMSISQRTAAAVALKQLGYKVVTRPRGVIVAALTSGSNAIGKLHPGDVITSVDGVATTTIAKLRARLAPVKPGQSVRLAITRAADGTHETVTIKTIADGKRAIVGFAPEQAAEIRLPIRVSIDAGNVGGPSAGLAFALEVMEELGRDVDHGHRVAVTGAIDLQGNVLEIGGVKQKVFGARKAKADVFLVPAGDNAKVARRYAGRIRVIPVETFRQALHALATLPPKR